MSAAREIPGMEKLIGGSGGVLATDKAEKEKRAKAISEVNTANQDLTRLDIFKMQPKKTVKLSMEADKFFIDTDGTKLEVNEQDYTAMGNRLGITDLTKGGQGVIEDVEIDPNTNKPVIDEDKLMTHFKNTARRDELEDIFQALSSDPEKNTMALDVVKKAKVAHMAWTYFSSGLGELFFKKLDQLSQLTDDDLSAFGHVASPNRYQEFEQAKEYGKQLEEFYNSIQEGVVPKNNSGEAIRKNKERQYVLFDRGSRILALDRMLETNVRNIDEELKKLANANPITNTLTGSKLTQANIDKRNKAFSELDIAMANFQATIEAFRNANPTSRIQSSKALDAATQTYLKAAAKVEEFVAYNNPVTDTTPEQPFEDGQGLLSTFPQTPLIGKLTTSAEQIVTARKDLFEEWNNISDIRKGEKFFTKNYDDIAKKYVTRPDMSLNIKITNVNSYRRWEKRMLPILKAVKKAYQLEKKYIASLFNQLLDRKIEPNVIWEYVIQNRIPITGEQAQLLQSYIADYVALAKKYLAEVTAIDDELSQLPTAGLPLDTIIGMIDAYDQDPSIEDLWDFFGIDDLRKAKSLLERKEVEQEQYNQISKVYDKTPIELNDINDALNSSVAVEDYANYSDDDFRKLLTKQFTAIADQVISAYKTVRDYDNLDQVTDAIESVTSLKEIFLQRDELKTSSVFQDFDQYLQDLLDELEKIKKIVEVRKADKFRKESIIYNKFITRIARVLGLDAKTAEQIPSGSTYTLVDDVINAIGLDN